MNSTFDWQNPFWKEQEYINETKAKIEEEVRRNYKWDTLKLTKIMTGHWSLVKTTTNQAEIIVWCIHNLPEGTWIPSNTSFRSREWLLQNGEHLTAFTLRWT